MRSRYPGDSASPKAAATAGAILLLLGLFVILTIQPPSVLEPGSGMGNYKMPGNTRSGQGTTPPPTTTTTTTTSPSPDTTTSPVNTAPPPTPIVDVLTPTNDTAVP